MRLSRCYRANVERIFAKNCDAPLEEVGGGGGGADSSVPVGGGTKISPDGGAKLPDGSLKLPEEGGTYVPPLPSKLPGGGGGGVKLLSPSYVPAPGMGDICEFGGRYGIGDICPEGGAPCHPSGGRINPFSPPPAFPGLPGAKPPSGGIILGPPSPPVCSKKSSSKTRHWRSIARPLKLRRRGECALSRRHLPSLSFWPTSRLSSKILWRHHGNFSALKLVSHLIELFEARFELFLDLAPKFGRYVFKPGGNPRHPDRILAAARISPDLRGPNFLFQ